MLTTFQGRSDMPFVKTELLSIAYEDGARLTDTRYTVLHRWPDVPEGWTNIAAALQQSGYRSIAPHLREFHPTEFLSVDTPRFAGAVAMAQDVIDMANLIGVERFAVVGHDWGARIAYTLAALSRTH
jgi:pimeloyl-ACP methyl ester carboxylesterase